MLFAAPEFSAALVVWQRACPFELVWTMNRKSRSVRSAKRERLTPTMRHYGSAHQRDV